MDIIANILQLGAWLLLIVAALGSVVLQAQTYHRQEAQRLQQVEAWKLLEATLQGLVIEIEKMSQPVYQQLEGKSFPTKRVHEFDVEWADNAVDLQAALNAAGRAGFTLTEVYMDPDTAQPGLWAILQKMVEVPDVSGQMEES